MPVTRQVDVAVPPVAVPPVAVNRRIRARRTLRLGAGVALLFLTVMTGSARAAEDPLRASQWYLDAIGADAAQRVGQGAGITVAVVDSGVDATHPDLAGSVISGPDLVDGDDTPDDENGHGTVVAGIIAARARNGVGIHGAAPAVKILAIRVLDANNAGNTRLEARGIDAAVAMGARVINLSMATAPNVAASLLPTSDIVRAIERAGKAGVVVVAAAGNDAQPVCAQPVLTTRILCVGAVNRQQQLSSYSNYALRVDLVAPGGEVGDQDQGIVSTGRGGGYVASAGTSEATPQVAATAAVLMGLGLSGPEAIDRIEETVTDLGPAGPDLTYARGLLNMAAAVDGLGPAGAAPADGPQPSGGGRAQAVAPSGSAPAPGGSCRAPKTVTVNTLIGRDLRVRCLLTTAGRGRASLITVDGKMLGHTSRDLRANARATLVVRLTPEGRRIVRRTKRHSLLCRITRRGAAPIVLRIRFRR
jgi:hypothetical protein